MATDKKINRKPAPLPQDGASQPGGKKPPVLGDVATELVRARTRAGMSLSALHRATRISRTVLQAYESGKYKPGARELRLLCQELKVSPNLLLFGTEEPFKTRDATQDLLGIGDDDVRLAMFAMMLKMLSGEERQSVITLVHSILEARHKDKFKEAIAAFNAMTDLVVGPMAPQLVEMMSEGVNRAGGPEVLAKQMRIYLFLCLRLFGEEGLKEFNAEIAQTSRADQTVLLDELARGILQLDLDEVWPNSEKAMQEEKQAFGVIRQGFKYRPADACSA